MSDKNTPDKKKDTPVNLAPAVFFNPDHGPVEAVSLEKAVAAFDRKIKQDAEEEGDAN